MNGYFDVKIAVSCMKDYECERNFFYLCIDYINWNPTIE
jgi:hypothetical protein